MRAHHKLVVQRRKKVPGSAGQGELAADGTPIPVRGNFHPLSAEEIVLWGDSGKETGTWFSKTWPGDIYCSITFRGAQWDQVAPAKVFDIGSSTQHVEVVIRRR